MAILVIAVLVGLSGYLDMRLNAASTENSALRAQVASLKRKLVKR